MTHRARVAWEVICNDRLYSVVGGTVFSLPFIALAVILFPPAVVAAPLLGLGMSFGVAVLSLTGTTDLPWRWVGRDEAAGIADYYARKVLHDGIDPSDAYQQYKQHVGAIYLQWHDPNADDNDLNTIFEAAYRRIRS